MSLLTGLKLTGNVLGSWLRITPTGLTSDETMVDPSNLHGHQGNNDIFVLTQDNADFQLFRSHDDLTFIHGAHDTASFWGGGTQTIYDYGKGTTLRFSELENARVDVFNMETDPTAKIVFFNATSPFIQSDGHGGTMVDHVDFHNVILSSSQVSFKLIATPPSQGGMLPL